MAVADLASSWSSPTILPAGGESGLVVWGSIADSRGAGAAEARSLAAIEAALTKAFFISLDVSAVTVLKSATPLPAAATMSAGTVASYDGASKISRMSYSPDVR